MAAPLERIVFATPRVAVGEWRCPPFHPQFTDSGPIQRHLVAFARTPVVIRHAGGRPFVADAGTATLYNRGQRYTREVLDPVGDWCDWWAVDDATAAEIAACADRRTGSGDERPLRFDRAPVDAALYLRQRRLLLRLRQRDIDAMEAEEAVYALLHDAVAAAARFARATAPKRATQRDLAHAAASELAATWQHRPTLDWLALRLGVSPFHLCRTFRAETGRTLHAQLTLLRVRASLEPVLEGGLDLTAIALDHGFCSHSHFTAAFRREFGVAPSALRPSTRASCRSGRN